MSRATEAFEQIAALVESLHRDVDEQNDVLSLADREVSRLYHEIECTRFHVVQGYRLARDLQEALRRRRAIKHEIFVLRMVEGWVRARRIEIHKLASQARRADEAHERYLAGEIAEETETA